MRYAVEFGVDISITVSGENIAPSDIHLQVHTLPADSLNSLQSQYQVRLREEGRRRLRKLSFWQRASLWLQDTEQEEILMYCPADIVSKTGKVENRRSDEIELCVIKHDFHPWQSIFFGWLGNLGEVPSDFNG